MFRFTIRDVLWLTVATTLALASSPPALWPQEQNTNPVVQEPDVALTNALKTLKNAELEWDETTFGRAGPKLAGDNARRIAEHGVDIADELLPLLDDKET